MLLCAVEQEEQDKFLAGCVHSVHSGAVSLSSAYCSAFLRALYPSAWCVAVQRTVRDSADRHRPDWEGRTRDKIWKRKIRKMFPIICFLEICLQVIQE